MRFLLLPVVVPAVLLWWFGRSALATIMDNGADWTAERQRMWEIAEAEKRAADPRGEHRYRITQRAEEKMREMGIVIAENYHEQRLLIGQGGKQTILPTESQPQKVVENEKRAEEDLEFWERLLGNKPPEMSTRAPTPGPSPRPSPRPSPAPTPATQTASPTRKETASPTQTPPTATSSPTRAPSDFTSSPTKMPTGGAPTPNPTTAPTQQPAAGTSAPTPDPTPGPTPTPNASPTPGPTPTPNASPTVPPTPSPTSSPTRAPTPVPTPQPSPSPTFQPNETALPTRPSPQPSPAPTPQPSPAPTRSPTPQPTPGPSPAPFPAPTPQPSPAPVPAPTPQPTPNPTPPPSPAPFPAPTPRPTVAPTSGCGPVMEVIFSVALYGGNEFTNPTSPQSQALSWLCSSDTDGLSDQRLIQRYALATIYYATFAVRTNFTESMFMGNIFPWIDSENWVTNANECTWDRIGCNTNNEVTIIDLFKNVVTGQFPNEFVLMNNTLQIFDVGDNPTFTNGDEINPYLGMLPQLTDLRYDETNFINTNGIPTQIAQLKNLRFYVCSFCIYSGALTDAPFPSDLVLETLDIEFNTFQSTIPLSIGRLPSLSRFYVRDCGMVGNLEFMRNLQNIFECWVDTNPGLGDKPLPTFLGTLTTLASFSATESNYIGTLPTEIGLLSNSIQRLFFYTNRLTGGVPTEYGRLSRMDFFQIQDNMLTQEIPQSVCFLTFGLLESLEADCEICPTSIQCCTECTP